LAKRITSRAPTRLASRSFEARNSVWRISPIEAIKTAKMKIGFGWEGERPEESKIETGDWSNSALSIDILSIITNPPTVDIEMVFDTNWKYFIASAIPSTISNLQVFHGRRLFILYFHISQTHPKNIILTVQVTAILHQITHLTPASTLAPTPSNPWPCLFL